jgi:hypothetical protein
MAKSFFEKESENISSSRKNQLGLPNFTWEGICGRWNWRMGPRHGQSVLRSMYKQAAVKNVETHLKRQGGKLPPNAKTPIQTSYRPELDVTPELKPIDAA